MKKKSIIISLLVAVVVIAAAFCFFSDREIMTEKVGFSSGYAKAAANSCNCETNWFPHEQTPAPKEGDGSPFDSSTTTNCMFHQWSWQKFLWLTKPLPSGNPLFLDSLNIVTPEMESVEPKLGLKLVLKSIKQAGPGGVLVSNPKYNNVTDTVYYSIHIDNLFKNKAIEMEKLIHSGKVPYSNLETFPVGALELKVSWINIDAIQKDKQADYFTTKAAVINKKGQYVQKTMALLGMHVVGVVKNHPEFIWATFEHKDMAPVYDLKNDSVTTANEMLFSEKGTTSGLKAITWDTITNKPSLANKAFILYEFGIPKNLKNDSYMATSQPEPANFDNITTINKCVAANLKDVFRNYFYNGSIWLDFDGVSPENQAKAIVTQNISSALPGSLARGSVNLANITMETYTQTFNDDIHTINNTNLVSCFTCHQSQNFDKTPGIGKSPLYLSHVFESYLVITKPKTTGKNANDTKAKRIEETQTLKLKQFDEFVKAKQ
ncbi:hypothetical protein GKZ90_0010580 [Flavobacterium sp. MC2016-06]|uniref:hypothetical protein n=1 Tax=Flavobacterium sp. MC2016-06 TaxID=2676308 RepID=UPI0012BB145F|nr:hypothetical protein [Flavobacterium sp. MC2016-06]MBU3858545.1 hypothetical protein [Flavobacterium sp. MC2016-06]